jgi:hypothetical protein
MAQVITNYSINGATPSTVGGTGILPKAFPNLPGPSIGVNRTTPSFLNATTLSSAVGQLEVPGSNRLNGQVFHILASGNYEVGVGGACPSFSLALFANTGTRTAPITTKIVAPAAFTAQNLDAVFYPWYIDVLLYGETLSGTVTGSYTGQVDGVAFSKTTLDVNLAGVNFSNVEPAFGLVLAVTFSVSEPGNSANAYAFQVVA